jgi:hypothetical protein
MSYRYRTPSPNFAPSESMPARQELSVGTKMLVAVLGFVLVSLVVLFAGRVPFQPQPDVLTGPQYDTYLAQDTELLTNYGYTLEGNVHIPIERAKELVLERGLPTR